MLTHDRLQAGDPIGHGPGRSVAELDRVFSTLARPQSIFVSNVAGRAAAGAITRMSSDLWGLKPEFVRAQSGKHGVRLAYADPDQLGVDRWLALVAARQFDGSPVCVADCGTAVTVDGMNGQGQHLGGWIIPGASAMQDALARNTTGIGTGIVEPRPGFGRNTAECVSNGSAAAIAALVDAAVLQVSALCGAPATGIVTGGGAGAIVGLLKCAHRRDPELVLRGLAVIAGAARE